MKIVFYKRLIAEKYGLTANERIIYSFLVYNSLCECEDAWDKKTGEFNSERLDCYEDFFDLPDILFNYDGTFSCTKISNILGISKATVSRALQNLKSLGFLDVGHNFIVHNDIYKYGYFTLDYHKLKGELLIFYSWMNDLKGEYNYIYADREKLAQMYHATIADIRDYIHRLKLFGRVKRLPNGKLLIK